MSLLTTNTTTTNTSSPTSTSNSSSLHHYNFNPGHTRLGSNSNNELIQQLSMGTSNCKLMLQEALKLAQQAVSFDQANNFLMALECYQHALKLITNVLESNNTFKSNSRLINIQASYMERVILLSNLVSPKQEDIKLDEIEDKDWLKEKNGLKYNQRKEFNLSNEELKLKESSSIQLINPTNNDNDNNKEEEETLIASVKSENKSINAIPIKNQNLDNKEELPLHITRFSMPVFKDYNYCHEEEKMKLISKPINEVIKEERRRSMPPIQRVEPILSPITITNSLSCSSPDSTSTRHSYNLLNYELMNRRSLHHRSWDPSLFNLEMECNNNKEKEFPDKLQSKRMNYRSGGDENFNSVHFETNSLNFNQFKMNPNGLQINQRPSSFLLASSKVVDIAVNSNLITNPKSRQYNLITIQRVFREEPSENCVFETPPISNEFRVFWLMRSLERSMTVGGYLSKKLYIPRSVWHQSGVRLPCLEVKIQSCELVAEYLNKFKGLDINDTSQILKELEGLDTLLNNVQNNLAKKMNFIEPLKRTQTNAFANLGNKISKSVEKIQSSYLKIKTDASSHYIDSLIKLFKASQFLEKWYQHFVTLPPIHSATIQIIARLNRVHGFLYNGICSFVLRDMAVMLAKYLKRLRISINE